jgi:hypothetical protein
MSAVGTNRGASECCQGAPYFYFERTIASKRD